MNDRRGSRCLDYLRIIRSVDDARVVDKIAVRVADDAAVRNIIRNSSKLYSAHRCSGRIRGVDDRC